MAAVFFKRRPAPSVQQVEFKLDRMDATEEYELIRKFLRGEQWAFDKLMKLHQKRVYRIALGMVGDHDEAADIAQEVFIKVFRSLKSFKFSSSFGTWIHRIAVNHCISQLRRKKLRDHVSLSEVSHLLRSPLGRPGRELALKDLEQEIEEAIAELPPKQRAIFVMHYYEELPHKEIARIMKRSEGAIKSSYCQAVKKLRKRFSDHGQIES
ncbi:RNA polymerase sigma factor [Candidatus Zixiibacteriota bacterium]